jgi:SpoIIAA-like
MPAAIEHDSADIFRLRLTGLLRKSEFDQVRAAAAREIETRGSIKLLFLLDRFEGWERGPGWGDLDFYATHGRNIERIAIVGDEKWRDESLMFAGAGLRKADVQYFQPSERDRARAWLSAPPNPR